MYQQMEARSSWMEQALAISSGTAAEVTSWDCYDEDLDDFVAEELSTMPPMSYIQAVEYCLGVRVQAA